MKTLYLIGGTMGVGKTAVCQSLKKALPQSVCLDGDWCWDADPFQITEETKAMVLDNIGYLLNNFLHCSAYENVIFGWVMHEQAIIDSILTKLDTGNCRVQCISLTADESSLRSRLDKDRSVARIPLYQALNTIKIDTSGKSVLMVVDEIRSLG